MTSKKRESVSCKARRKRQRFLPIAFAMETQVEVRRIRVDAATISASFLVGHSLAPASLALIGGSFAGFDEVGRLCSVTGQAPVPRLRAHQREAASIVVLLPPPTDDQLPRRLFDLKSGPACRPFYE